MISLKRHVAAGGTRGIVKSVTTGNIGKFRTVGCIKTYINLMTV